MWIFLAESVCPAVLIERLSFSFHSFSCFQWRLVTQSIGYREDAEFRGSLSPILNRKDVFISWLVHLSPEADYQLQMLQEARTHLVPPRNWAQLILVGARAKEVSAQEAAGDEKEEAAQSLRWQSPERRWGHHCCDCFAAFPYQDFPEKMDKAAPFLIVLGLSSLTMKSWEQRARCSHQIVGERLSWKEVQRTAQSEAQD